MTWLGKGILQHICNTWVSYVGHLNTFYLKVFLPGRRNISVTYLEEKREHSIFQQNLFPKRWHKKLHVFIKNLRTDKMLDLQQDENIPCVFWAKLSPKLK